ncbi:MAG TPA: C10 family peptidase [Verrucomicrobiae bacterium]
MKTNLGSVPCAGARSPKLMVVVGLTAVLLHSMASARELSEREVRVAVQTWVRTVTADARPDAAVERMEPYIVDGKRTANVVHLTGGGFCLAGADDLVLPVYLYNPRGIYAPGSPAFEDFLREIDARTQHLRKLVAENGLALKAIEPQLEQRKQSWQKLVNGQRPLVYSQKDLGEPYSMELHLTSLWHQGSPYNAQTPDHPYTSPANQHTPVGCNATAQSQIMYYWKWPPHGTGSASATYPYRWRTTWDEQALSVDPVIDSDTWGGLLEWTASNGGRLRMYGAWDNSIYGAAQRISDNASYRDALASLWGRLNQGSGTYSVNMGDGYNWSLMSDSHPTTAAGDAEVAKLCGHVSVSMDSEFGLWGTSSRFEKWKLQTAYYYDSDIEIWNNTTHSTMISLFTDEIKWLRPVVLSGFNTNNDGHAYVVYGYSKSTDPDRQFLMNMGWGPGANAHIWYTLDTTPFKNAQAGMIKIAPEGVVRFVDNSGLWGVGSPSIPYANIGEAVQNAPSGTTLIFKAGSLNTFASASLVINKPLVLKGFEAVIRPL